MTQKPIGDQIQIWHDQGAKIALWIGRAKLPHIGHIAFLKALWKMGHKLVIGNGSCYTIDPRNPIHTFEIQSMLGISLLAEGIPQSDFTFIQIPDAETDKDWKEYIQNIPNFHMIELLASDNKSVTKALKKLNLKIVTRNIIQKNEQIKINATMLREAIRDNNVETWNQFAAYGTKMVLAQSGGFQKVREAMLGREVNYIPGRQCVDMFIFAFDGVEWNVILGNRKLTKDDFAGALACPGGGIDDYENVIEALLRETTEETGIVCFVTNPYTLPTEICIANELSHLYFVGMSSTEDVMLGGSKGGSSLGFMTIYDGGVSKLKYHLRSNSDLDNVRPVPVRVALQKGLAFQQTERLEQAWRLLKAIRRQT